MTILDIIRHPLLRDLEMGSEDWFAAQQQMIKIKPSVRRCYDLWYEKLLIDAQSVPPAPGTRMVELGSGASSIQQICPEVLRSDVEPGNAELVFDGRYLPFRDQSLRALFLTHVFHHIPDVRLFLREASRVLVPGGVVSIVDETHTPFARMFFDRVHPEPYDDARPNWSFPAGHSMLDSNQALAWIVFFRDRTQFANEFPDLKLEQWSYLPWYSYLLSGGVNLRSLIPKFAQPAMEFCDHMLRPLDPLFAIHWHLTLRKADPDLGPH